MDNNLVFHPQHYTHSNRKECWEEMRDIFGDSAVAIFDILSAYKYLYRAGTKEGNPADQDKAKIENYKNHCRELLNNINTSIADADMVYRQFMMVQENGFNPYQE